ncbi:uncharacterized protein LOC144732993 isoform X1 [Lampetra planeri]
MPVDRMRMRPWLELKLNSGSDPCLSWIDKEKGIFMVSWRHASRSGWNESTDASIFREWAIHTGKFREDHVDPKTWKANFRCALHSLCDVRERRDLSTRRGGQAARVYVMLAPRTPKKTSKMKYRNRRREMPQEEDVEPTQQDISRHSPRPHTPHHSSSLHTQLSPHHSTHPHIAKLSPHHSSHPCNSQHSSHLHTQLSPQHSTHSDTPQLSPHHPSHPRNQLSPHHSSHQHTPLSPHHPTHHSSHQHPPHHSAHLLCNSETTFCSSYLENPHLSLYTDAPHHAHQWKTPPHHSLYSHTNPLSLLESPELLTPASATFCSSPGGEDSARSDALGFRLQISASYTVLQGGGAEPEVASDDDVIELVDHLRQLHETAWEPRLVPWSAPY